MADTSNTAGQQSGGRRQAGQQPAGQGRLAQLIATRGGTASPEAPFVIEHREALIYMLCEAAELEHGIMCQYLYAAFSMKQGADEGLTDEELAAVRRWRSGIAHVATQEMLHLALVHNLLSAIGAAPHLVRPNLPQPANYYPAGVQLALLPFGAEALQHFMFLERPEGMDLQDADGLRAVGRAQPHLNERDIVPRGQDFATVGHLYRSIEAGLRHLVEMHGEDWLFVGPPRAQATTEHFGWPELVAVTDLASAQRAIDEILEQGEGPRGHWRDAHFGQFVEILDEYQQMLAAHPDFDPVRPVVAANVRPHERDFEVRLITDPLTARVADLFNVGYEILLQTLERFFAHTEESDAQLKTLADVTIGLMIRVLRPLGNLITTLPAGPDYPGRTAGPTFELFYEDDYLMPHQEAAWALLAERMDEAAALCLQLQAGHEQAGHEQAGHEQAGQAQARQARQARQAQDVAAALAPVLGALRDMSRTLAAELPAGTVHARLASVPDPLDAGQLDELRGRARELAGRALLPRGDTAHPGDTPGPDGPGPPAPPGGGQGELADLFGAVHAIVLAADRYSPVQQALIVPRLVDSVLRPLADELDGGAAARRPGEADSFWAVARAATELRARLAGDCPPGLAEAVAALQDLAGRLAATPEQAKEQLDELWRLQAAVAPELRVAHNGPYLVTGVPRLLDYLGTETRPAPQLALCRCGQSALKPLCDGSHARTGFTDAKDPKRVADHRDTYPGQQVTIFDNRGICQHSGLCTDRLATVFRTDAEPFVAPSGGRLDEVIRAVRDCPSGALSYAIDDVEGRAQVDWDGMRPTTIEVTKDGPYRITGELALTNATGQPEPQGAGASREHYALCRCGQSRNKPFCSGMHWYVGFRDPQPPGSPTLYEWAGGGPALTRMSRLLYEKHVPADSLLAARFAQMPRDQAQRLAGWLSGALGGPGPAPAGADGGLLAVLGADTGDLGEDERARWVALAGTAADEARLPADAGFRAALSSCLEWLSRTALAGEADADGAAAAAPRWDWGPAGPPAAQADTAGTGPADDALPGPGEEVGFAAHIKPLFRARDRQSMSFALDLWSYDDVRAHAADIVRRLQDGSMPCDGAWSAARIEVFQRWADTGLRP